MKKILLLSLFVFSLSSTAQNPGIFLNTTNWSKVYLRSLLCEDLRTWVVTGTALIHPALATNLRQPALKRKS